MEPMKPVPITATLCRAPIRILLRKRAWTQRGDRVGETAGDDIGAGDRRSHNHKTGPELPRLPRFLGSPNPPFRYEGQAALAKLTQQLEIGAGNAGGIGSVAGERCADEIGAVSDRSLRLVQRANV